MQTPRLEIITIVLDGEPWIERHLVEFQKLRCDWHWHVIEGVANNRHCTNWCKPLRPRLSNDGTTEYLAKIAGDPRITIRRNAFWDGKIAMVNAPMESIKEPAVVMQIDSDELWTASQLDKLIGMFRDVARIESMQFFCRYFVGKNIITTALGHYGNNPGEWLRAWRYHKGARFQSHEPPVFNLNPGWCMPPEQTNNLGLNFLHMAYATEAQVRLKEYLYGYENAVAHWKRLQENTTWPVRLKDFLPWVDDGATADKLKNKTS